MKIEVREAQKEQGLPIGNGCSHACETTCKTR